MTSGAITAILYTIQAKAGQPISWHWIRRILLCFLASSFYLAWHDAYLSMKGREADLRAVAAIKENLERKLEKREESIQELNAELRRRSVSADPERARATCAQLADFMRQGNDLRNRHRLRNTKLNPNPLTNNDVLRRVRSWESAVVAYLKTNLGDTHVEKFLQPTDVLSLGFGDVPAELWDSLNDVIAKLKVLGVFAQETKC